MFKSLSTAAVVAASFAAATPATASSVFSSFFVFGDSLSDNGNLFSVIGAPPAPYFDGRFSNGPVWAEYVQEQFANNMKVTANFAFGGAKARTDMGADDDGIPDLAAQLGIYDASIPDAVLGGRPLAALWFGANDLLNLRTPADIGEAMTEIAGAVTFLAGEGFNDFLVPNLPNIGVTPRATMQGTLDSTHPAVVQATALTVAYNEALEATLLGLEAGGARVHRLDVFSLSNTLAADPAAFDPRLATVDQSCLAPGALPCDLSTEAIERVFFDEIHPNAVVHENLGRIALAQVNSVAPVPLPASFPLLGAALLGFAALRRRKG